jgi:Flp pilus assembly protein TadG
MARPTRDHKTRRTGLLTRFARAERGATAVEFAFVALPFLALIFAVVELGLVFMVGTTLENATEAAARQIRTGELQTAGGSAATFKAAVCAQMSWLGSDCTANLSVDVRTYSTFSAVTSTSVLTNGAVDPAKQTFTTGGPEDIVLVRTFYQWTIFTPLLNAGLVNLSGNKRLITSTATFRNEPYTS